jgi:hypothetical protein
MNTSNRPPTLCPACLDELPDNDPCDHVAIDHALTGRPIHLTHTELIQAIHTGRRRGLTWAQISTRLHRSHHDIRQLAQDNRGRVAA